MCICCQNALSTQLYPNNFILNMIQVKSGRMVALVLLIALCLQQLVSRLFFPSIIDLLEIEKCPACYGTSLCSEFVRGHINLNSFSLTTGLMNIIGSKNVLFGTCNNRKVVLKKLGHKAELAKLDEKICKLAGVDSGCYVNETILQLGNFLDMVEQYISQPLADQKSSNAEMSGLRLCPSVKNLKHLLSYGNLTNFTEILQLNIWTIIMINPEPLVLQILRAENGWPVPKYLGECGRVVVEEYIGDMLTTYHHAPWMQRVSLAHQLMVAAHNFTNSHPHFSFYLTDISADNIAVDANGKVKFIDLENVIVVDKKIPDEDAPPFWKSPHESNNFDCDGCFAFSSDDICSHRISDHNFYAVCQLLLGPLAIPDMLPGGLLHDVPPAHENVLELLQQCSEPKEPLGRFAAAQKLTSALADILKH